VEKEFEDRRAIVAQQFLEGVNIRATFPPHFPADFAVDQGNEHVFIMRSIPERDGALAWRRLMHAPEKIVIPFFGRGVFEIRQLDAVGVESQAKVFDCAVLATGVHPLHDDEHTALMFGVKRFLQLGQFFSQALDFLGGIRLGIVRRFPGIDLRQPDLTARLGQDQTLDLFWTRQLLLFCLPAQTRFTLSTSVACRNAISEDEPGC